MKTNLIFSTVLILFTIGCKPQQYTTENLPDNQIIFGKGGGITGAVDTYILLENGQLFHSNSLTGENKELENIGKKEAKACFAQMAELTLSELDFDYPGNMYYFLEEVNGDAGHKVTWGSNDHKVSNECQELYDRLRTTLK